MNAFVNGAISAFDRILEIIDQIDPYLEDENLKDLRGQIIIYEALYKELDKKPKIKAETWEKIEKVSNMNKADLDELKKIIDK